MAVLVGERLRKSHGDRRVLDGVDVACRAGEVVAVVGRSGSGKTTLLHVLAGLDRPSGGRVLVEGVEISSLDEEARSRVRLERLGVVFQRFHLIPELTIEENIRLPARLAARPDAKARAADLLRFFGIDHLAATYPSRVSGGELQRAAVARALVNGPAVLLADEPSANLDAANAELVFKELRRVADETRTGVVVATHDDLVLDHADRVLQMTDGLICDGDASTIPTRRNRPSLRAKGGPPSFP